MVGKSSLAYRLVDYNVNDEHDPTIEDRFAVVEEIDKKQVSINVVDTAGQQGYQNLLDTWIDIGEGFILVFAINDKESFEDLDRKKARIDLIKKKIKVPIVLVGNKSDMENSRKVSKKEAEEKAKSWDSLYFETSAKDNQNCKTPFIECARKILNLRQKTSDIEVKKDGCCNIF